MKSTNVVTSVTHGTSIHMDACAALSCMRAIALSLISYCDNVKLSEQSGRLLTEANNGQLDFYVEQYCHGVHGAVLNGAYREFADIMYSFVLDCVKNQSVNGLYLWTEKTYTGMSGYELITYALEVYDDFIDRECEVMHERRSHDIRKYSEYNDQFKKLFMFER